MLSHALAAIARGWAVFPVHSVRPNGSCRCSKGVACKHPGKHPLTKRGFKDASDDEEIVRAWWAEWPDANVGIATGSASGIWVLDVDPRHGGDKTLQALEEQHGTLRAPTVRTGGGGFHFLFLMDSDPPVPSRNGVVRGIDVKGEGGYVVGAGSKHASGGVYCWADRQTPEDIPLTIAPQWLLEIVLAVTTAAEDGERQDAREAQALTPERLEEVRSAIAAIPNDDRGTWLKVGMALHSTREPEARAIWDEWSRPSTKFDPADQQRTWEGFTHDKQNDITLPTLFRLAKQHGWKHQDHKEWKKPEWVWRTETLATLNLDDAFPPDLAWLAGYCREHARVFHTPPEFGAMLMIGMLAGSIGGRYEIVLENVEWRECSPLWVLVAMRSGHGKSLVFKLLREPFDEYERQLDQGAEFDKWKGAVRYAELGVKAIDRKIMKALTGKGTVDNEDLKKRAADAEMELRIALAARPPLLSIIASNFTTPALSKFLMEHDERCVIIDPEGSVFGQAFSGTTDVERNIDPWLKAYSCEPIKENRIGDGTRDSRERYVQRPILGIAMCTQTGNLALFRDAYAAAKGFLARFMVLVLPYELPDTAISEGVFDPDLRQQWSSLVQEILSLRRPQEPIRVTLSGEAADYFKSWLQSWLDKAHIDAEADEASIVGYGSAFGAKLRGMALRMILALHVARCSTPDAASPDLETVRAVLDHWVPFIRANVSQVSSIIRDDPDH
jgi:hypothetical protein